MKDNLIEIFNNLKLIKTTGNDTVIMNNCLQMLNDIINIFSETKLEKREMVSIAEMENLPPPNCDPAAPFHDYITL